MSSQGDGTVLELVATNPDPEVTLVFSGVILPEGIDGSTAAGAPTERITIAPRTTRVILAPPGVGLWRLEGDSGLQISARLRVPGGTSSHSGHAVPILSADNVHPANAMVEVQSLLAAPGYRSDFGLFNAGHEPARCEARVSLANGGQVGPDFTLDVAPLSFNVFENVPEGLLGGAQVADARVTVRCDQSFFVLSRTVNVSTGQVSIQTAATDLASGLPGADAPFTMLAEAATTDTRSLGVALSLDGVKKAPSVAGSVISSPSGINCGSDCNQNYTRYTLVTLTPKANSGYTFSHWSGGQGDCADGVVKLGENRSCTANFVSGTETPTTESGTESRTLTMRIKLDGVLQSPPAAAGKVTSSPAGISCGTDCSHTYPRYTNVVLTATANSGYSFSSWSGSQGDCSDGNLRMGGNRDCIANFVTSSAGTAPPPPPPPPSDSTGTTSRLWGVSGELWDPSWRLPDVSRAGYREGGVTLPRRAVTHDIKINFGAAGNGSTDDTAAFKKAISSVSNGVVFIPKGRYRLSDALNINKSNLVFRGAGPGETVLFFSKPVKDTTSLCKREGGAGGWRGGSICVGKGTSVTEIGLEDFSIEFPPTSYRGHHKEYGYNGITFHSGASHSWVRNVTITDTDSGHDIVGGHHNTMTGLVFKVNARRSQSIVAHHFLSADVNASYNLFRSFVFEAVAHHDLTVWKGSHHNVFSKGRGVNVSFDHHGDNANNNVYTDIVIGSGSRIWLSGGNTATTPPFSGARETFWNIRDSSGRGPSNAPGFGYTSGKGEIAPYVNVIGAQYTKLTEKLEYVEGISPAQLAPQNIYEAQLKRRVGFVPVID